MKQSVTPNWLVHPGTAMIEAGQTNGPRIDIETVDPPPERSS